MLIDSILTVGNTIIDKLFPDKAKADEYKLKLAELEQQGQLKLAEMDNNLMLGQIDVNKVEAQSENLFKSGWRPFIGWMCGICLTVYYIPQFLCATIIWTRQCILTGQMYPFPIDATSLTNVLMALLGLAAFRTSEKVFGVKK